MRPNLPAFAPGGDDSGELVAAFLRPLRVLRLVVRYDPQDDRTLYTPVRDHPPRKCAPIRVAKAGGAAAHKSQVTGKGRSARMFRALIALPTLIFGLLLGREWFAEPGAAATIY